MTVSDYWHNIEGCLDVYRDFNSVGDWLSRAKQDLPPHQFAKLLDRITEWINAVTHTEQLEEHLLPVLKGFDEKKHADIRTRLHERRRILLEQKKRQELEAQRRRQIEETERIKREEEERARAQREQKRQTLIARLTDLLKTDFLAADSFFQSSCLPWITKDEFNDSKRSFVKHWFSNGDKIAGLTRKHSPDLAQVDAIAEITDHALVIARAGSGKTATLVNRVIFLLQHCRVPANSILVLAFNRKAAVEVRRRILESLLPSGSSLHDVAPASSGTSLGKPLDREERQIGAATKEFGVELPHVMTFHALAYSIVQPEESLIYDDADADSLNQSNSVQQVIDDHLTSPEYRKRIRSVMIEHFKEDWEQIIQGGYLKDKADFLKYRRSLPNVSLRGEHVKSFGEKAIANFLFEHGIPYNYEQNHHWDGFNYKPDFTIHLGGNKKVIIEYFGMQGDPDYDKQSQKKRAYWKGKPDYIFLELSPRDLRDGYDAVRQTLHAWFANHGMRCDRLSENEIWERIKDRAIDRFTKAMRTFIARCRKMALSLEQLKIRIEAHDALSPVESQFINIGATIYQAYLKRLNQTGEEDFDGLMCRAAEAVRSGTTHFHRRNESGDLAKIQFICVDEFQDFSQLFLDLLNAILGKAKHAQVFCVGDDWQAINGFAGSDLEFYMNFGRYFNDPKSLNISTNYRSARRIVDIGNELMRGQGNPAEPAKEDAGGVFLCEIDKIALTAAEDTRHNGDIITPAVLRVCASALTKQRRLVVLCRRNSLPYYTNHTSESKNGTGLDRFLTKIRSYFPKEQRNRITISNVHKYKGLEKDVVIVLDAVDRAFPLIHPDWVFTRVFGDTFETLVDEERRLFYVAMTRAVDQLFLFTESTNKSPFLQEIKNAPAVQLIDWKQYPPVSPPKGRLIVKISNQDGYGANPTIAIKNELKAAGYRWRSTERCWIKDFDRATFSDSRLKIESWFAKAHGIEVRIVDESDSELTAYRLPETPN